MSNEKDPKLTEHDQHEPPNQGSLEFSEAEDDEPLGGHSALRFDAFVQSSDWTTETIVAQLVKGSIDVNPGFQRRDAWSDARKCKFIESIALGIPIPQLVLAERDRGQFVVLDGKQRLLTLLHFSSAYDKHYTSQLKLRNLDYLPELDNKTWADIESDPDLRQLARAFENAPIRTVVIRNWKEESFLHLIFHRLNSGSLPLSSQELRTALHPGEFTSFINEQSANSKPMMKLLGLKRADFRMRDAELLLRSLAFDLRIEHYQGNLREFLDHTQMHFNSNWELLNESIVRSYTEMNRALEVITSVHGDSAGKMYANDKYERTLNRAVVDALLFCYRSDAVKDAAWKKRDQAISAFQEACRNEAFARSVQLTTKTPTAVFNRMSILAQSLSNALGVDTPSLSIKDNKLSKK